MIPVLSLFLLWTAAPAPSPPHPSPGSEIVAELSRVSAFDISVRRDFVDGLAAPCETRPSGELVRYPTFESTAPLFGTVSFPGLPPRKGAGSLVHFALDRSRKSTAGYDRLYLDLDRDLDLTDGEPLELVKYPPAAAVRRWDDVVEQACFERFEVPCDFGEAGIRPVELLPRLVIQDYDGTVYRSLDFIGTHAWRGELEIGGSTYEVRLGHDHSAVQRFDDPDTALLLSAEGRRRSHIYWRGGDRVCALHELDGTLYEFVADPTGETLTVRPYAGAFGELAIGAGQRELSSMTISGGLRSVEHAVAVGTEASLGWPKPVERCRLPVGDYYPTSLSVRYGDLVVEIGDNPHADGELRGMVDQRRHGIAIREDRPFILDFATAPEVLFVSPKRERQLMPGDTLEVTAALVDPGLGIMLRGLDECFQPIEETIGYLTGGDPTNRTTRSLAPRVIIRRQGGGTVAEEDMPFGRDGTCRFSWRVPETLEITGDAETFDIFVRYDTKALYGRVRGHREVTTFRGEQSGFDPGTILASTIPLTTFQGQPGRSPLTRFVGGPALGPVLPLAPLWMLAAPPPAPGPERGGDEEASNPPDSTTRRRRTGGSAGVGS